MLCYTVIYYIVLGLEQLCPRGVFTYHSTYNHGTYKGQYTYGGYADKIRVHQAFAFAVPDSLSTKQVASLMWYVILHNTLTCARPAILYTTLHLSVLCNVNQVADSQCVA